MHTIKDNITAILSELPSDCRLVAVSKTKPNELIKEAYDAGQLDFGENKVQELATKAEDLPKDIRWHMIGHLQRNKVKYIAPFIHLIHGVDSKRLLLEINKQGLKNERVIDCLLQIHIAAEDTKFGFDEKELKALIIGNELESLENIRIVGLMGMATHTDRKEQVKKEFETIALLLEWLKGHKNEKNIDPTILSTGMSGDYKIALEAGSNMVRIGSAIFGPRNH